MSIIASASVPPEFRLHDAPTTDLAALQRPRPADSRFPLNGPYAGRAAVPTETVSCPAWCPGDCAPEVTLPALPAGADPGTLDANEYFDRARMHERFVANVPSVDAEINSRQMHTAVEMERFDGPDGKVVEDTSITVTVMAKDDGESTKIRLTLERAEALGRALIEAATLARAER